MTYKTKKDRHVNIFYDFFWEFFKNLLIFLNLIFLQRNALHLLYGCPGFSPQGRVK